ncbi:hypothetical protein SBF1_5620002 [Candidatus Desulfosporosinus infrequens]|uniref:Uncharacterized protein n=1 Tax=Candidatus Desulfosporosinus infrequens TaxID=2043169 RepID=A0A2U3LJZ4_9FIRM|nr:hypothetical protein SBF1_5620002 [Candidatus Desulfosporosinus infrequens]
MAQTIKVTFFQLLDIALITYCIPYHGIYYTAGSTTGFLDDLCIGPLLERMLEALRRHDIYVAGSERYDDPRAQLLQGSAWNAVRPQVLRTLDWFSNAEKSLAPLEKELDSAYRNTVDRWEKRRTSPTLSGRTGGPIKCVRFHSECDYSLEHPLHRARIRYPTWRWKIRR